MTNEFIEHAITVTERVLSDMERKGSAFITMMNHNNRYRKTSRPIAGVLAGIIDELIASLAVPMERSREMLSSTDEDAKDKSVEYMESIYSFIERAECLRDSILSTAGVAQTHHS